MLKHGSLNSYYEIVYAFLKVLQVSAFVWFSSVIFPHFLSQPFLILFSRSVTSDFLRRHGLQHARLLCSPLSPRGCSNLCPLSQWYYPLPLILCHSLLLWPLVIPSIKFFFSESALYIRWLKYWSFSFNTRPSMSIWDWFPIKLTSLNSFQSKVFSRGFYNSTDTVLTGSY